MLVRLGNGMKDSVRAPSPLPISGTKTTGLIHQDWVKGDLRINHKLVESYQESQLYRSYTYPCFLTS